MKNTLMIRPLLLVVACALMSCTALAQSQGQTLADAARKARAIKPATTAAASHVYNNDNLPKEGGYISVVGTAREAPAAGAPSAAATSGAGGDDKGKEADEYRSKVAATKGEITQLERELNVLQRENQIRVAEYYGDAGAQMQNQRAFLDKDREYKSQIAAKQQALEAAKAKLEDIRDQARKAGVPNSATQ